MNCQNDPDTPTIHLQVSSILGQVVPLIDFPNAEFIQSLTKDLSALVTTAGIPVC